MKTRQYGMVLAFIMGGNTPLYGEAIQIGDAQADSKMMISCRDMAQIRMRDLANLIKKAEARDIDTLKERTALRTAEIFLDYADWDEAHVKENTAHFAKVHRYKKEAAHYASLLPRFERTDIAMMMQTCYDDLNAVMKGEHLRRPSPEVDWSKLRLEGSQILYKNRPIFLADWTWKPTSPRYTQYFGQMSGAFLSPSMVEESMTLRPQAKNKLEKMSAADKAPGAGMVFLSHAAMAGWAVKQDPSLAKGAGNPFVNYDITHPLGKKILQQVIAEGVPPLAGKKCTQLGYMLCNEPRWVIRKGAYSASSLSPLAVKELRAWLQKRHGSIAKLNQCWGTQYESFAAMDVPAMVEEGQIGSPMYYDVVCFNMERVNAWFRFLRSEVLKYDPKAKTHIKVMPDQWTDNARDHGIDLEELCRMTEIIGNDASTTAKWSWGPKQWWEDRYSFNWRELCMGNDFMRSVQPDQILFNSEGHLISTNKYRNLFESPEYIRMNYWLAYLQGMNVIQSWYWSRLEDGSSHENDSSVGYAGSNNHQPRVVNEVHACCIDINSMAEEMAAFQSQRRPIRLYYSDCSAINKPKHMDELFELYEKLFFEGVPLGFSTEGIIKNRPHGEWDAILVVRTPYVRKSELDALQGYLQEGGTVILDRESLAMDEYGREHSTRLHAGKGRLIYLDSWQAVSTQFAKLLKEFAAQPVLQIEEKNARQLKTCVWRVQSLEKKGHYLINLINIGNEASEIRVLPPKGVSASSLLIRNYLNGEVLPNPMPLGVYGCLVVELIAESK